MDAAFSTLFCDSQIATFFGGILAFALCSFAACGSFNSFHKSVTRCREVNDLLESAIRAEENQSKAHDRDAVRLNEEMATIVDDIDAVATEHEETSAAAADYYDQSEELLQANEALSAEMDRLVFAAGAVGVVDRSKRARGHHQHLLLTADAIHAEIHRVWSVEISRLQGRIRVNGEVLDKLMDEMDLCDDRDELIECCVALQDRTFEVEVTAEEAEELVWQRSVQRVASRDASVAHSTSRSCRGSSRESELPLASRSEDLAATPNDDDEADEPRHLFAARRSGEVADDNGFLSVTSGFSPIRRVPADDRFLVTSPQVTVTELWNLSAVPIQPQQGTQEVDMMSGLPDCSTYTTD